MKCGNYIAGAGLNEKTATEALLDASHKNGLVREDGEESVKASIRSGIKNGKAKPRAVPPPKESNGAAPRGAALPETKGYRPNPKAALAALITDLRCWQDLPDPGHIVNALAAAATRKHEGEACWLLLVAPPSSGKTEGVRLPRQHCRCPTRRSHRCRPAQLDKRQEPATNRLAHSNPKGSAHHLR